MERNVKCYIKGLASTPHLIINPNHEHSLAKNHLMRAASGACEKQPYLLFQLRYLVFEVSDVLAGVRVVQLPLDLPFFFLLQEEMLH